MHMNVIKSLNQRGQHNWIKILCLAVGLATGVVLIGKAGFEQSWDKDFDTTCLSMVGLMEECAELQQYAESG